MAKIIDLYSGAGGLSLGAARAGFKISAAVELDRFAIETHKMNFPSVVHIDEDVSKLSGRQLLLLAGLKYGELDGIVGGPPCQGFSFMGRREVLDNRNDLFSHFFRLVAETKPKFFLAENVPGILDAKYDHIRKKALALLENRYVVLKPITVKANLYGAPTTRTRIFFIGYDPTRMVTDITESNFAPSLEVETTIVKKALKGLPLDIDPNWQSEKQGWRTAEKLGEGGSLIAFQTLSQRESVIRMLWSST